MGNCSSTLQQCPLRSVVSENSVKRYIILCNLSFAKLYSYLKVLLRVGPDLRILDREKHRDREDSSGRSAREKGGGAECTERG